jgi:hypothetical protein
MHMSRQLTGTRSIRPFRRSALLLILTGLLSGVTPRSGSPDAEFTRLPFAEWAAQGKLSDIHWAIAVPPATLSAHQRLIVRVTATVDGRELAKRRGRGDLTALIQFEDSAGVVWQNHTSLSLETVQKGVAASDVQISHYAFVLPGDYQLSIALCDTATREHSFATRKLHVAGLKKDPLPNAWAGLPPVEFIRADSATPDIWYLPEVETRLNLPVVTRRPVHVELLVNATPSERASGSITTMRHNMSLLIPALKAFSEIRLDHGSIDAALLDLTHRRIAWEQKDIHELDWNGMRRFLLDDQPGKIDVHALEGQRMMRKFFFDEVNRRMAATEAVAHVVIVLSGPAFLEEQESVEAAAMADRPNRGLIYIRDRTVAVAPRPRPGYRPMSPRPLPARIPMPLDDLEQALLPLSPRVYDAASADQFRRILAAVLQQIAGT